jgi:hypothetical protein
MPGAFFEKCLGVCHELSAKNDGHQTTQHFVKKVWIVVPVCVLGLLAALGVTHTGST